MARVLLVPSALDCDPSEVALPWSILTAAGHSVVTATTTKQKPVADPVMLTGKGLGPLAPILMARKDAVDAWSAYQSCFERGAPNVTAVSDVDVEEFAAVVFPGGHAKGMREFLESNDVQRVARDAFTQQKIVGAICHGVVVLARAGVLKGKKTTSLTKKQELLAWNLTRAWLGDYYRTYPQTVQDEVTAALSSPSDYLEGPMAVLRDDHQHLQRGFVVEDGAYVSARWPGDVHRFTGALMKRLSGP